MSAFTGIISSVFKQTWSDAIDALLEDTALTTPCLLLTEHDPTGQCPNCVWDAVANRSRNIYKAGGPVPFTHGQCPYCHGWGVATGVTTDTTYLMVIWHYKEFIGSVDWSSMKEQTVFTPFGYIQTLSRLDVVDKLRRAREILVNSTTISPDVVHRFSRVGEPNPIGLDGNTHIITTWKRIS